MSTVCKSIACSHIFLFENPSKVVSISQIEAIYQLAKFKVTENLKSPSVCKWLTKNDLLPINDSGKLTLCILQVKEGCS